MKKDARCEDTLCSCLYFASNKLNRLINKMADEEFKKIGLSTSHTFALMAINTEPGLPQIELSRILNIKPSTTSRFIDQLEIKGLATRKAEGKVSYIYPTKKRRKFERRNRGMLAKPIQKILPKYWEKRKGSN
jgi:Transcriptional regulators